MILTVPPPILQTSDTPDPPTPSPFFIVFDRPLSSARDGPLVFKFNESAAARSFDDGDLLHLTLALCKQQLVLVKEAISAKELEDPQGGTHGVLLP